MPKKIYYQQPVNDLNGNQETVSGGLGPNVEANPTSSSGKVAFEAQIPAGLSVYCRKAKDSFPFNVKIGSQTWHVTKAEDNSKGLSGTDSLEPKSGILFELEESKSMVHIDMQHMKYSLDIIFITPDDIVSKVLKEVMPGVDVMYTGKPVNYFLEVNAGDAKDIKPGDDVQVESYESKIEKSGKDNPWLENDIKCLNCGLDNLVPRWGDEFHYKLDGKKIHHCLKCGASYKDKTLEREPLAENRGEGFRKNTINSQINTLLEKSKEYLFQGELPPHGELVQIGPQGGRYFENIGRIENKTFENITNLPVLQETPENTKADWHEFKPTITLYHGSSDTYLDEIKKNGLKVPNAKQIVDDTIREAGFDPDKVPQWLQSEVVYRGHQSGEKSTIFTTSDYRKAKGYSGARGLRVSGETFGGEIRTSTYHWLKKWAEEEKLPIKNIRSGKSIVIKLEVPKSIMSNSPKIKDDVDTAIHDLYDRIKENKLLLDEFDVELMSNEDIPVKYIKGIIYPTVEDITKSLADKKSLRLWLFKQEAGGAGTIASGGFTPTFGGSEGQRIKKKILDLMEKSKVYLTQTEQPPKGAVVQRGKQGGRFYFTSPHFTDKVKTRLEMPEGVLRTASGERVPPAWKDVWVTTNKTSHVQATGTDAAGRKVYLYSAAHNHQADAAKFKRLKTFQKAFNSLRQKIENDAPRREEALVLYLIMNTGFRIGAEQEHIAKVKAYGAATLQNRHIKVVGDRISFDFIGKKGVHVKKTYKDPFFAGELRERLSTDPEQPIFKTTSLAVRNYLHSIPGGRQFKIKDFRTYMGTDIALKRVKALPMPETFQEFKKFRKQVSERVSEELGNTSAVALRAYIAPEVFSVWEAKFADMIKKSDDETMQDFINSIFYDNEDSIHIEDEHPDEIDDEYDDYDESETDEEI